MFAQVPPTPRRRQSRRDRSSALAGRGACRCAGAPRRPRQYPGGTPRRAAHSAASGSRMDGRAACARREVRLRGTHRQRLPDHAPRARAGRGGDAVRPLHVDRLDPVGAAPGAADSADGLADPVELPLGRPRADRPGGGRHAGRDPAHRRGARRSGVGPVRGHAAAARRRAVRQLVGARRDLGRVGRPLRPLQPVRRGDGGQRDDVGRDALQLVGRAAGRQRLCALPRRRTVRPRRAGPGAAAHHASRCPARRGKAYGCAGRWGATPSCRPRAAGSPAT